MSVAIRALTDTFAVAPQLGPDDMPDVANAGFRSVIINRPDLEGGPDQPLSADVIKAAQAAGLQIEYQPVVSGAMTYDDVECFAKLLKQLPEPVLAYCRSGARCTALFEAARQINANKS
ncbi:TIGR01244 family sulfur transferase [Pusillimonas sp. ANT_WB101]|uniref:TIGR01244 family sulfur transferase n=1 Tax=Pusillimonas sp. ANT_WB101 TaxID=2597356 RepID=UPI0011ECA41F|nr:TIGR01244 family sulfur transferase [Pusillimonas sp. ANT_WB101]KAA0890110.1 TIGR01244 family phosphatase [Pusillimonas sp. ANT_WB101]NYT76351.1 TIGR01244 family phosphatase [Alcaligenaceae bacterium]